MAQKATQKQIAHALLERHGRLFSEELNIDVRRNTPSPLFRWLCFSLLASTRISTGIAMKACQALADHGWTTVKKMSEATWRQRTDALNHAGYARYDESTSRYLGDTCDYLLGDYGGDLRKLRDAADRHVERERALLKNCKGIGDVGADIFCREIQVVWEELYPFADKLASRSAEKLDLPGDAKGLAKLVSKEDYPRLIAALVRTELARDHDAVRGAAR